MKYISICVLTSLLLFSCSKDNPFVPKEVIDELIENQNIDIQNVSFIYNNDIYFLTNFEDSPEQITNSPSIGKSKIKMSFDYQKFAYLNANGIIEIIDRNGNLQQQLTQYTNIKSFDWSYDNTTLYILNNNQLVFSGSTMNVPTLTYPSSIPSNVQKDIVGCTISISGDLAYIIHTWDALNGDQYMMINKPNNGSNSELIYNAGFLEVLNYIQFSSNKKDLVLGYGGSGQKDIELFKDFNQTPEHTFESSENYGNSIYRSDINYMLTCYQSSSSNNFILMARNLIDFPDKDISHSQYNGNSTSLSLDWK
jgi:hypothetical protein